MSRVAAEPPCASTFKPVDPVPARTVDERQPVEDLHLRQRGLGQNPHEARLGVRHEGELHRLEIDQQRVGPGVVGAGRLLVETRGVVIGGGEIGAVEHEIAADFAQPPAAQVAQQQPEIFQRELGIAPAFQHEIAFEHAAAQRAGRIGLGHPLEGGAEQLERGIGSDELDGGRRIHRARGAGCEERALRADLVHVERGRVLGNFGLGERAGDGGGEKIRLGVGARRTGRKQRRYGCREQGTGNARRTLRTTQTARIGHGQIMRSFTGSASRSAAVRVASRSISSSLIT